MEKAMTGEERREKLMELLGAAEQPMSGAALGRATGVSRQVVVQDMALLRTEGRAIVSTARGYVLEKPAGCTRLIKVCHTDEETEEELLTVVDLGGTVEDVMVNHRAYGQLSATLHIRSRRDVQIFLEQIRTGKSVPLLNVTSGYHFHHIAAESEAVLDEIQEALREKGFLAAFLPYEQSR